MNNINNHKIFGKKTALFLVLVLGFFIMTTSFCVANADEIDTALTTKVSHQIREQVREMINAGVDQSTALEVTKAMIQNRFQERHILQSQQMVKLAASSGIPIEPVVQKIKEGIAKGINDARLVKALKSVNNRYSFAYRQARSVENEESKIQKLAERTADCLSAGMEEPQMLQIMKRLRQRIQLKENPDEELAIQTMTTTRLMARSRINSETITDAINQALKEKHSSSKMMQMRLALKGVSNKQGAEQVLAKMNQGQGKQNTETKSDGSGSNGSGGDGSGGNGSGGDGSGGNGSGGNGSGGNGSGGNGSGGKGSGGN
ncbi:MAG: hypothetical protein HOD92_07280 [Deltaproteobacteria bacterium]|jgi:hypothetical protein|nr:hypothetical protein [Deltaproteobacteria bacterium]MBT4527942.1 hypothetical protein [Deltaproteobacteria bacterium]